MSTQQFQTNKRHYSNKTAFILLNLTQKSNKYLYVYVTHNIYIVVCVCISHWNKNKSNELTTFTTTLTSFITLKWFHFDFNVGSCLHNCHARILCAVQLTIMYYNSALRKPSRIFTWAVELISFTPHAFCHHFRRSFRMECEKNVTNRKLIEKKTYSINISMVTLLFHYFFLSMKVTIFYTPGDHLKCFLNPLKLPLFSFAFLCEAYQFLLFDQRNPFAGFGLHVSILLLFITSIYIK